jgi:hypothetical protein
VVDKHIGSLRSLWIAGGARSAPSEAYLDTRPCPVSPNVMIWLYDDEE